MKTNSDSGRVDSARDLRRIFAPNLRTDCQRGNERARGQAARCRVWSAAGSKCAKLRPPSCRRAVACWACRARQRLPGRRKGLQKRPASAGNAARGRPESSGPPGAGQREIDARIALGVAAQHDWPERTASAEMRPRFGGDTEVGSSATGAARDRRFHPPERRAKTALVAPVRCWARSAIARERSPTSMIAGSGTAQEIANQAVAFGSLMRGVIRW